MRSDRERLSDILDCIAAIDKYASCGRSAFDSDELIQNWMIRHISILGEAASKVSASVRVQFSNVPWGSMIGMRNRLVHDYIAINNEIVWNVVANELPLIKPVIEAAIVALDASP